MSGVCYGPTAGAAGKAGLYNYFSFKIFISFFAFFFKYIFIFLIATQSVLIYVINLVPPMVDELLFDDPFVAQW